ncbi:MAG: hypothetical protein MJ236_01170 [Clostridia bacterium]|nr:hypothetical protein [Clostridia bacterium]
MIESGEAIEYLNRKIPELEIELDRLKAISASLQKKTTNLESNVNGTLLGDVKQNAKDIADLKSIINVDGDIDLTDITKSLFASNTAVNVGSNGFICNVKGTYLVQSNGVIVPVLYDGVSKNYTFKTASGADWAIGISSDGIVTSAFDIDKYVYASFYDVAAMVQLHEKSISTIGATVEGKVSTGEVIRAINDSTEGSKILSNKLAITSVVEQKADQADLDSVERRVATCESDIITQEQSIGLMVKQTDFETAINQKADSDDVDEIANRVTIAEGSLVVQAGKIEEKASVTSVENLGTELRTAINGKTGVQEFTTLQTEVTNVSRTVDAHTGQIASKVSNDTYVLDMSGKASVDDLNGVATNVTNLTKRVATSETLIEQNKEDIKLKASTTQFNDLNKAVVENAAQIVINAGAIEQRATKKEVTDLSDDVKAKLAAKADSDTVATMQTTITNVSQTLDAQAGLIASKVSNEVYVADKNSFEQRISSAETEITQTKDQIALKADSSDLEDLDGKVTDNAAQLVVQAGLIASKVSSSEYEVDKQGITNRLSTAESEIVQTKEAIALKVDKKTVDDLSDIVSSNTSRITATDGKIEERATKTEVTNLGTELRQSIDGKADSQEVTTLQASVTDVSQRLDTQAGVISTKVSEDTYRVDMEGKASKEAMENLADKYDELGELVESHSTELKQTSDRIEAIVTENGNIVSQLSVNNDAVEAVNRSLTSVNGEITSIQGTLTTQGNMISAKLDASGGSDSFGWHLAQDGFRIVSNGDHALSVINSTGGHGTRIGMIGNTYLTGNLFMTGDVQFEDGAIILKEGVGYGTQAPEDNPNLSNAKVGQLYFKIKE